MKIIILLLLLAVGLQPVRGQAGKYQKPDYKEIEKKVADKNSIYYYPVLFERYRNSDTTLSMQDYRMLYYGYFFNDSFSAFPVSEFTDSLKALQNKDTLRLPDYRQIIRFEEQVLLDNPFNPRDLNWLEIGLLHTGDTLKAFQTDVKLMKIFQAILSTGDGRTEKTAWHVIAVSHEYDLLNALGFQFGGSQSLTNSGCDYLKLADNDLGVKGFYFDVTMLLKKEGEAFKK